MNELDSETKKRYIIAGGVIFITILVMLAYKVFSNDNKTITDINYFNGKTINCNSDKNSLSFSIENGKVKKYSISINRELQNYGFKNTIDISNNEKMEIETRILNELKINSFNNDGISITFDYPKKSKFFTIKANVDYKNADNTILKKLEIPYESNEIENLIKTVMNSDEYKCKY